MADSPASVYDGSVISPSTYPREEVLNQSQTCRTWNRREVAGISVSYSVMGDTTQSALVLFREISNRHPDGVRDLLVLSLLKRALVGLVALPENVLLYEINAGEVSTKSVVGPVYNSSSSRAKPYRVFYRTLCPDNLWG